ncbi:MAG: hypothetical protein HC767_06680 [Akkermansiaceae bacterium]|nr:hypothetical protein [Akkermansiaceae bacterium]
MIEIKATQETELELVGGLGLRVAELEHAELDDVGLVADAPMSGDHVRAAFLRLGGNGQTENLVQARDEALHAATALDVAELETHASAILQVNGGK